MSTNKINPRLVSAVKRKRKIAANLLAFQRCEKSLAGFTPETQATALRATAAILGIKLS